MRRGIIASSRCDNGLREGLVAHYLFDCNSNDELNNYNGTDDSINYSNEGGRKCAVFTGGKINIGSPFLANGDMSVSFWFKTSSTVTQYPMACRPLENFRNFIVMNSTLLNVTLRDNITGAIGITDNANYANGNWHHIAYSIDRTNNELKLYIDKVLINTADISIVGNLPIGDVYFGYSFYDKKTFRGYITDGRIYHRVLTSTDVTNINDLEK